MKIYLDFDRTLFDTNTFLKEIYIILNKYNIPLDIFDEYKKRFNKMGYNCYKILQEMEKKYFIDNKVYNELDNLIKNDNIFIYADVIKFLDYLKNNNFEIILLTKGNEEFQKMKIINSGISNYFTDIIITLKHKGELSIDYNAIFIDDNIKELRSIGKNKISKLIYIDRSKQDNNQDIITINSLSEAYNYLN